MQTLLLTVATAIILAVVAAFAAPSYVDWAQWRGTFETQMARAVGAPVVIRGPIAAEILPVPRVVLQDVSIGADEVGTRLSAAELRASFSLGALIKGELAADRLKLVKPRVRLVLDATGKVALPTGASRPSGFSIAHLEAENGTLELLDRASGRAFKLDDIDLRGEIGGPAGPLKLEGEIEAAGRRQTLRLALGAFAADGGAKLRVTLQGLGSPLAFDADGVFRMAGAQPAFEGRASLATPAREGAATPLAKAGWSLSGNVRVARDMLEARELSLTLGNAERPIELTGSGRLGDDPTTLGRGPGRAALRLDLSLAARQIDLNAATAGTSPLAALGEIAQALAPLSDLAPAGTVALSSDTVLLGGAPLRELRADIGWSGTTWQVKSLQARLPGRSSVRLSGQMPLRAAPDASIFTGNLAFDAEDLPALVGWASPSGAALLAGLPPGAASLNASIEAGPARLVLQKANVGYGGVKLTGDGIYVFPDGGKAGRIDAALAADGVDLDALLPPARRLLAGGPDGPEVGLAFSGRSLRLAGIAADRLDLTVERGAEGLAINRLTIGNLGGLNVTGSGRLAAADSMDDARFEAKLAGAGPEGLAALARGFGPAGAEELVRRLGPALSPLDLAVTLQSSAGRSSLAAKGTVGKVGGAADLAYGGGLAVTGKLGLDLADGADLLGRLGVPGLKAGLGPARLDATLSPPIDATLAFAGARLTARGEVTADAQGLLRPRLDLQLEQADLARLLPAIAAAADPGEAVPASFAATLTRPDEAWRLDRLKGSLAGVRIEGSAAYAPGKPEPLALDLALDRWNLPRALSLVTGRASGNNVGGAAWPEGRFGAPPLADLTVAATLGIKRLDLPGNLALEGARLRARLAPGALALEEISGTLAGGTLSGNLKLRRRTDAVEADGHLALNGAELGRLFAPLAAQPALTGRMTLGLDVAGTGRSPLALAQALAGQGSLAVDGFQLAGLDPRALQYTMLATERGTPPDGRRTAELMERALARGALSLARVESSLSVLNGVARTGAARVAIGTQRFALEGSLDLARLSFEASVEMEDAADPRATAPPGAVVHWRGPLGDPNRRLDVTALSSAINMRALERETKRLEAEYGRSPVMDAGHSTEAPEVPSSLFSPNPIGPPQPAMPPSPDPAAAAPPQAPTLAPEAVPAQAAPAPASAPAPAASKPQAQRVRPAPMRMPEVQRQEAPALPPPVLLQPDPLLRPPGSVPMAP